MQRKCVYHEWGQARLNRDSGNDSEQFHYLQKERNTF